MGDIQLRGWEYSHLFIALIVLMFLFIRFKRARKLLSSRSETGKSILIFEEKKLGSRTPDVMDSMGVIQPLTDLNWEAVEPKKIYKFSPKYFLTMGLQNTTINQITHIDKLYLSRLSARRKILQDHRSAIACLPAATDMVSELYTYLTSTYLPRRYPTIFHLHPLRLPATHLRNTLTQDLIPLTPPLNPLAALRSLATTLDDDFIMLLPSSPSASTSAAATASADPPFSLQAYIWCYPAGFAPAKLLGLPLAAIHAPVPGYAAKLERSMDRYFARLEPGRVVTRTNWSIATTPALWEDGLNGSSYHLYDDDDDDDHDNDHNHDHKDRPTTKTPRSPLSDQKIDISQCYLRCELQTLFALPQSRGRVLALHLYMYPLTEIRNEGGGAVARELCEAIDGLKRGNVPQMWRYKSAVVWGDAVKAFLRS